MVNAVYVAPFLLETTLRFADALADQPGVRLGLVTQDPAERLPTGLRRRLAGHWRVDDGMNVDQIAAAVGGLNQQMGAVDRLVATLEPLQVPVAQVRERLGIDGMGAAVAQRFRDKALMKEVLASAGLRCARHRLATSGEDGRAFAREVGYPLVIKPREGTAGTATYRVKDDAELERALAAAAPSAVRPALFEEFVTGRERSFETVSIRGEPVWSSHTRYEPTPLTVLENPWIQWTVMQPREVQDVDSLVIKPSAYKALEALGMGTGISHLEWFRLPDGSAFISEVAARPPGAQIMTLNSWAHDVDFYRLWARLVTLDEFAPPTRHYAVGAAYFRGQGSGSVRAIHGLEEAQRQIGELVVESKLPRIGQSQSPSYEGEGYAIVRHPETEVVAKALSLLVATVRVELG